MFHRILSKKLIYFLVPILFLVLVVLINFQQTRPFHSTDCYRTCYDGLAPSITTRADIENYFQQHNISPNKSYKLGDTSSNPIPLTYSWIVRSEIQFIREDSYIIATFGSLDTLQQMRLSTTLGVEDIERIYGQPDEIFKRLNEYDFIYEDLLIVFSVSRNDSSSSIAYLVSEDNLINWGQSGSQLITWQTFLSEINAKNE